MYSYSSWNDMEIAVGMVDQDQLHSLWRSTGAWIENASIKSSLRDKTSLWFVAQAFGLWLRLSYILDFSQTQLDIFLTPLNNCFTQTFIPIMGVVLFTISKDLSGSPCTPTGPVFLTFKLHFCSQFSSSGAC